jgi:hypothetical protein
MPLTGCNFASPAHGGEPQRITRGLWLMLTATGEPQKKIATFPSKGTRYNISPCDGILESPAGRVSGGK